VAWQASNSAAGIDCRIRGLGPRVFREDWVADFADLRADLALGYQENQTLVRIVGAVRSGCVSYQEKVLYRLRGDCEIAALTHILGKEVRLSATELRQRNTLNRGPLLPPAAR